MVLTTRRVFAVLILVLSSAMLLWSVWPFARNSKSLTFSPEDVFILTDQTGISQDLSVLETRTLSLKWPKKIRVGELQSIELAFMPEKASLSGPSLENDPAQASYLPDEYSVLVDGRLDLTGVNFSPEGQVSQLLQLGQPLNYLWNVQVNQPGKYEGTVWLYLRLVSKETGQESRQVLSAQLIEFTGENFLGLNDVSTWLIGSLGLAIGVVLTFDKWVVILWNTLWRKAGNQSVK